MQVDILIKYNVDGSINQCTTRLVAKGFIQRMGWPMKRTLHRQPNSIQSCSYSL